MRRTTPIDAAYRILRLSHLFARLERVALQPATTASQAKRLLRRWDTRFGQEARILGKILQDADQPFSGPTIALAAHIANGPLLHAAAMSALQSASRKK